MLAKLNLPLKLAPTSTVVTSIARQHHDCLILSRHLLAPSVSCSLFLVSRSVLCKKSTLLELHLFLSQKSCKMITPEQLLLVKKTLPLFNEKSVECAEEMYRNIFRKDASLRGLFSVEFLTPKAGVKPKGNPNCPFAAAKAGKIDESISVQARILAATIVDFAANIDNISSFESKIDRICNLHVSRDIRPAHYGVVAAAFEEAAKTVLGDAVTEEEHNAWMAAVMALAGIFIEREKEIRERAEDRKGVRDCCLLGHFMLQL